MAPLYRCHSSIVIIHGRSAHCWLVLLHATRCILTLPSKFKYFASEMLGLWLTRSASVAVQLLGEYLEELLDNDDDEAYVDAASVLGNLLLWHARGARGMPAKPEVQKKIVYLIEKYEARDIFSELTVIQTKKGTNDKVSQPHCHHVLLTICGRVRVSLDVQSHAPSEDDDAASTRLTLSALYTPIHLHTRSLNPSISRTRSPKYKADMSPDAYPITRLLSIALRAWFGVWWWTLKITMGCEEEEQHRALTSLASLPQRQQHQHQQQLSLRRVWYLPLTPQWPRSEQTASVVESVRLSSPRAMQTPPPPVAAARQAMAQTRPCCRRT